MASVIARANPVAAAVPGLEPAAILGLLPSSVIVVDAADRIVYVNSAAETLLDHSSAVLQDMPLRSHVSADSPVFALIRQARASMASVSEDGITIDGARIGLRFAAITASPLHDETGSVIIAIHERSIARKIDHPSGLNVVGPDHRRAVIGNHF